MASTRRRPASHEPRKTVASTAAQNVELTVPDAAIWQTWYKRWNQFQASYVPHREEQFDIIAKAVSEFAPGDTLCVLDLAAGPGCLAERVLQTNPRAELVVLDFDPWLAELGRRAIDQADLMTWISADLREESWVAHLPHRSFHAVVTATALHTFSADALKRIYAAIRSILLPGGVLLNADVMPTGSTAIRRFGSTMLMAWQTAQMGPVGIPWHIFWKQVRLEPAFAPLLIERDRLLGARPACRFVALEQHVELLSECGFRESGEIWRYFEAAILAAAR